MVYGIPPSDHAYVSSNYFHPLRSYAPDTEILYSMYFKQLTFDLHFHGLDNETVTFELWFDL